MEKPYYIKKLKKILLYNLNIMSEKYDFRK